MNKKDQARIFTFLLTSARGCVDEPPLYGPLRLLEVYSLLLEMLKPEETDGFYYKLNEKIEKLKDKCMEDEVQFVDGLDRVLEELTDHVMDM